MIDDAVRKTMDDGVLTPDLGGSSTTTDVGDCIIKHIQNSLKLESKI
jgi:isocitrate/isopropylmalate dehydrogenase